VEHWQKYVEYLNHIELLFRAGRDKVDVLQAIINMHRSIKRWEDIAREQAEKPLLPAVEVALLLVNASDLSDARFAET
jgi:hypothetical protein